MPSTVHFSLKTFPYDAIFYNCKAFSTLCSLPSYCGNSRYNSYIRDSKSVDSATSTAKTVFMVPIHFTQFYSRDALKDFSRLFIDVIVLAQIIRIRMFPNLRLTLVKNE